MPRRSLPPISRPLQFGEMVAVRFRQFRRAAEAMFGRTAVAQFRRFRRAAVAMFGRTVAVQFRRFRRVGGAMFERRGVDRSLRFRRAVVDTSYSVIPGKRLGPRGGHELPWWAQLTTRCGSVSF